MQPNPYQLYWSHIAHHWDDWAPPLRPDPSDIRSMESMVARYHPDSAPAPLRALLWGVTPEIANMSWPENTQLLAVDRCPEMIAHVWPGDIEGRRRAQLGFWLEYPARATFNVAVGDGIFSILRSPHELRALAEKTHQLLNPHAIIVARLFTQARAPETPDQVFADLHAGRIGNFHIFKFRLAMALHPDSQTGVRNADVYELWDRAAIKPQDLTARFGWSPPSIATIAHFQNNDARLYFHSLQELDEALSSHFERIECDTPTYEMGDRCPTVCYRHSTP